jgi:hypothetical protein
MARSARRSGQATARPRGADDWDQVRLWQFARVNGVAVDKVLFGHTWLSPAFYERAMLMTTIGRLGSVAAFFMCLAIALWAMWLMLGAAFVGEWLQVARTLILWTAAAATAHLCLVPLSLPARRPTTRAILDGQKRSVSTSPEDLTHGAALDGAASICARRR